MKGQRVPASGGLNEALRRAWRRTLRRTVMPLGDRLLGQRMMARLRILEQAQWWDRKRLSAERDRLLAELLAVSYREVPLYRELWDRQGVKPQDVRTASDLAILPLVTKDMLRAGYPSHTVRATGQRTHEECSSGSTGRPFCVQEDAYTAGWYRASFILALQWSGWRIGDPQLQMGMTLQRSRGRRAKDLLLRCHYVSAYDLTDAALDAHLERIDRRGLRHVWGYPGAVYFLARRAAQTGWNLELDAVVTWGDTLFSHYRNTIEAAFHTRVFDTYGCAEGMQISAQCGHSGLYHVHDLDVIVEYLDDDGDAVAPADPGNLVVTRLHPGPMPLIRYRVGDVGVAGEPTCGCGRGFSTMDSIRGRETDVVTTPSGNRLIVHFFTGVLEHFPEIDTFQVTQERPDSIVVRIVPGSGFDDRTGERVATKLKEKGADLTIEVEVVDEIPLTPAGKRRFVINRLPSSQSW
jgi:phenylacetate-CoA ligase